MNGDGEARPHRYGRHTDRASGEVSQRSSKRRSDLEFRPYRGEHYYGLPVVKPSPWGWLIASYFFLGGLAGAAQVVATVADLFGGPSQRPVVRTGRYLALAGTLISPVLLILDLHTPTRWYNMLRIARPTSPMSIGSWVLSAFGFSSSIAAATHFWRNRTQSNELAKVDRIAGILGAVSGAAMSTYTATLLSGTSTPLWLTAARPLPVLFGSTAIASAIAAIDLILGVTNPQGTHRRPLSLLGLFAAGVQLWSSRSVEQAWGKAGLTDPRQERPFGSVDRVLVKGAGIMLPAITHVAVLSTSRPLQPLVLLGSFSALLGSFAERWLFVVAGNSSANRPADYFTISQPSDDSSQT